MNNTSANVFEDKTITRSNIFPLENEVREATRQHQSSQNKMAGVSELPPNVLGNLPKADYDLELKIFALEERGQWRPRTQEPTVRKERHSRDHGTLL